MGVTGLWKLIEPCGQPIPLEMLENKVLAVDISIWLHQVVKGFQDNKGSALANAHLLGLFHRLCKLMYYRIKPVFVFDGKVPQLKRETIAKRNQKRNKLLNEADRIQALLLQSLAKEKVVQKVLGVQAVTELLKVSPSKKQLQTKPDIDDIFKLPDLPEKDEKDEATDPDTSLDTSSTSDADSSIDESKRNYYNQNLQAIDVKSQHFRNLPTDIRHEILIDIKETRKQSSWGKLHELPSKGSDFSVFQMKRLLKRRQVQESLEQVEKEMDGVRAFTISELENIFSEEGIIEPTTLPNTKRISSDENTRYLLVRDLKKTLETVIEADKKEIEPETSASALQKLSTAETKDNDEVANEDDPDLQKAIQMSLDESAIYSERDYEYTERYKLNKDQRKNLKNAAVGLARAYMIEHAGMNEEDVEGLLDSTQNNTIGADIDVTFETANEDSHHSEEKTPLDAQPGSQVSATIVDITNDQTICEGADVEVISDLSSDSDLEEVVDGSPTTSMIVTNESAKASSLQIVVDVSKKVDQSEDLFADVFSLEPNKDESVVDESYEVDQSKDILSSVPLKVDVKRTSEVNTAEILDSLKKQASEVTQIKLNDIKIDPLIIAATDGGSTTLDQILVNKEDRSSPNRPQSHSENNSTKVSPTTVIDKPEEIIEITDDDPLDSIASRNSCTPSKSKTISEFFETKYIIKRTPDKAEETKEDVPHVKSPFFHNKLKRSGSAKKQGQKRSPTESQDEEESPKKLKLKAAKMLFEESDDNDTGVKPIKEENPAMSAAEEAAHILKETKTQEELQDLASTLAKDNKMLEMERNRQDRMGMSITEKMNSECMELLRLFGIPFIVAPMEAEAQCAYLDAIQLTNGTITDDSDIWLFGGRTVYKNFFAQNKHVMEFRFEKIENSFHVNRHKLIQLALLVGSDYTTGVNGIGAVTALEILASFNPIDMKKTDGTEQVVSVLATLRTFRDWWVSSKSKFHPVGESSARHKLRNKLKNIELSEGFPSEAVIEAYLAPTVDNSKETFSWGLPDVESIREFTRTNFGWPKTKTDDILGPVLKRLNEKRTQSTINNYFTMKTTQPHKHLPVSKRVQKAINKMSADYISDEDTSETKPKKKPRQRKRKQATEEINNGEVKEVVPKKSSRKSKNTDSIPSTSSSQPSATNTNQPKSLDEIPQRQKDLEEMEQKKQFAASLLKKIKSTQSKK